MPIIDAKPYEYAFEKDRVAPREAIIEIHGNGFEYTFPPYSVTVLRF